MTVLTRSNLGDLRDICILANVLSFDLTGGRNTCIFTSGALWEALIILGIPARMMRVEAAVYIDDKAMLLGYLGCGWRQEPTAPGMWNGHVAVIADDTFLLDPTIDRIKGSEPFAGEVTPEFLAGDQTLFWVDGIRQTTLPPGRHNFIRYYAAPQLGGWRSKPAFRTILRQHLAREIAECWSEQQAA